MTDLQRRKIDFRFGETTPWVRSYADGHDVTKFHPAQATGS